MELKDFDAMAYAPAWIRPLLPAYVLPIAAAIYLIPVGLAWAKPQLFPRRQAPKALVQAHNLILVAWSAYMSLGIVSEVLPKGYKFCGNPFNPLHTGVAHYFYHFYISKLYEFMDTYIMLYRGKLEQVSFLHVYHHVGVFYTCWLIAKYAPGGDSWLPTAFNAFVHIIMYSYYFLCTAIGDNPKARAKYLWWGRHLTQLQISQFVVYLVCGGGALIANVYPRSVLVQCEAYALGLLILFTQFYLNRWNKKEKKGGASKGSKVVEATNEVVAHATAIKAGGVRARKLA